MYPDQLQPHIVLNPDRAISSPPRLSTPSQALATRPGALETARSQTDYLLLDGSGSMMGENWHRSCAAIDAYVAALQAEGVSSHIYLHSFDDKDLEIVWRDCQLADWRPLADDPIGSHWSGTPLYDAINLAARRLRDIDPQKASLVILTDGEENNSKTSLPMAQSIIRWMQAKGWQVTFIGCEFANHRLAEKLGARSEQAIGVQRRLLSEAAQQLAKKRANYARTGAPMHWTADEQQQFGGYLAAPRGAANKDQP